MAKKQIKTGVVHGAGDPPYQWGVIVLALAFRDAIGFLSPTQYSHLAGEMQRLARETDPSHSDSVSVDAVEDFFELRDWGGTLRNLNVRVFFGLDRPRHLIVALGAIAKKNNGPTPSVDKSRMHARWRKYLRGGFGAPPI